MTLSIPAQASLGGAPCLLMLATNFCRVRSKPSSFGGFGLNILRYNS